MEKEKAMEIFREEFDSYESKSGLEDWTGEVLATLPDYFWEKPASSTGKHHNLVQNGPHGNIVHTKMNVHAANDLFSINRWGNKFDTLKRDMIRTALILHDGLKYGDDATGFVVHEHPVLMAQYIMNDRWKGTIPDSVRSEIAGMVAAHSGQWTKSKHSGVILPLPASEEEFFVHLCDYIGSRDDIMISVAETRPLFSLSIFKDKEQQRMEPSCGKNGDAGFDERIAFARMLVFSNNWNGKIYGNEHEMYIFLNGNRVNVDKRFYEAFQMVSLMR